MGSYGTRDRDREKEREREQQKPNNIPTYVNL